MTNKESFGFEEVWKSLEEQDKTGVYKRARETADLTIEQLEYAFNSGYEIAKAKYERSQGMWIPVSKGLPEKYKEVIVTDIETHGAYVSRYIGDGYWECDNGPYKNRIIAWQPLPKTYKEGDTE